MSIISKAATAFTKMLALLDLGGNARKKYEKVTVPVDLREEVMRTINEDQYFSAERYVDTFEDDLANVHLRSITMRAANDCRSQNIPIRRTRAGRYKGYVNTYPYPILNAVVRTGPYED